MSALHLVQNVPWTRKMASLQWQVAPDGGQLHRPHCADKRLRCCRAFGPKPLGIHLVCGPESPPRVFTAIPSRP